MAQPTSRVLGWGLMAALAAVLAFTAYFKTCTGFSPYDDTGYVMLTEKTFFAGHPLYDQTYTQYGPAYYAYKRLLLAATGLPLSHDSTLLFAAVSWVLSSLLCAGYVWWTTRSLSLAGGAMVAVFAILDVLRNEPGHPEGFCVLLLAAALYCASLLRRGRRSWFVLGTTGVLAGLMAMTKANVGIFACLAFLLWLLRMAPAGKLRRLLFTTTAAAALLFPIILMRRHLAVAGAYCALEFGGILILVLELRSWSLEEPLLWKELVAGPAGMICAVAGCAVYALATGTSPAGLLDGLVLQHLRFDSEFFLHAPFEVAGLVLPFGAAALVYYAAGVLQNPLLWKLPIAPEAVVLGSVPFVFVAEKVLFLHGAVGYCLPVVVAMARVPALREKSLGGGILVPFRRWARYDDYDVRLPGLGLDFAGACLYLPSGSSLARLLRGCVSPRQVGDEPCIDAKRDCGVELTGPRGGIGASSPPARPPLRGHRAWCSARAPARGGLDQRQGCSCLLPGREATGASRD